MCGHIHLRPPQLVSRQLCGAPSSIPERGGLKAYRKAYLRNDTVLLTENAEDLQLLAEAVNKHSNDAGLEMNVKKTKTMVITKFPPKATSIKIKGESIEQVSSFKYLGQEVNDSNNQDDELKKRINLAKLKHASFLKDVLEGKIEGSRPRGRQRRRWIDDITEWTGKDMHQCTVEAQDRAKWKSVSSQPLEQGRHREMEICKYRKRCLPSILRSALQTRLEYFKPIPEVRIIFRQIGIKLTNVTAYQIVRRALEHDAVVAFPRGGLPSVKVNEEMLETVIHCYRESYPKGNGSKFQEHASLYAPLL
ncbi:endonuclease-reverse transcriptase [Elysia marginata]|uniref:Endonuclease-reverse transcriptase n=1 Tax=Elysia marginata TaxID=1093978 RepID=A0AAV4INS8_9GAST|nr:endonuclease-reverse transcriptase [Elysia marginata]